MSKEIEEIIAERIMMMPGNRKPFDLATERLGDLAKKNRGSMVPLKAIV